MASDAIKPKKKDYVDKKEFYAEIVKSKQQDELTREAVKMFSLICENKIKMFSYKYFEDREDAIQLAFLKFCLYWRGFDENTYSDAFTYFTQMAKHAFAESFNKMRPLTEAEIVRLDDDNIHNIF